MILVSAQCDMSWVELVGDRLCLLMKFVIYLSVCIQYINFIVAANFFCKLFD